MSDIYARKTGEVKAKQWDGTMAGALDVMDWLKENDTPSRFLETNETSTRQNPELVLISQEGNKHAVPGNWFVNDDGTWLLLTAGTFRRQYEKKEE